MSGRNDPASSPMLNYISISQRFSLCNLRQFCGDTKNDLFSFQKIDLNKQAFLDFCFRIVYYLRVFKFKITPFLVIFLNLRHYYPVFQFWVIRKIILSSLTRKVI